MVALGKRSSLPLTARLCGVLAVGALALSVAVTVLFADYDERQRGLERRQKAAQWTESLARRAAPLLDVGDVDALAEMASTAAELADAHVVILGLDGRVLADTSRALDERIVPLTRASATRVDERAEGGFEVTASCLGRRGINGEIRLRAEQDLATAAFPWGVFALVVLFAAALISAACWMTHAWLGGVRRATLAARRLARQDDAGAGSAVDDLERAMAQLSEATISEARNAEGAFLRLAHEVMHSLETRGHVPVGHGERTRRLVEQLARELGVDAEEREVVTQAAMVMDLGKVGVRPSALQKTGGLNDVERESLRQHPARGAALLASMPGLAAIGEAVRHRYERWDGGGYPEGLRGDRIPWTSRLLAIASAFDELAEELAWPDALDRLREDRGEVFDPTLFDAFEASVRSSAPDREEAVAISGAGVAVKPYRLGFDDGLEEFSLEEAESEIFACGETELEFIDGDEFE